MAKKKLNKKIKVDPVFHIFCEGEKTEPYYINGYINHYHSDKRNIVVVEDTNKNTPVQLVEVAIEHKKKNPNGDVYWVVFDRESVIKYSHELHLRAKNTAESHGIKIAISNVCFEFWLLLHLKYSTASYSSYDDLISKSNLKTLLTAKGLKKEYDKADILIFDTLKDDISTAIKNAEKVKINAFSSAELGKEFPCFFNAYTDVHELFIDMKIFIDKKQYADKLTQEEGKKESSAQLSPEEIKKKIEEDNKSIRELTPEERKKKILEIRNFLSPP